MVDFNHVQHISFTQSRLTDAVSVILNGLLSYEHPPNPGDIFEIMNIPGGSIVYSQWISPVLSSYFFNINGLLLPEVSILSHGAILAREMGIPAIGGISCGFVNGMEVEMDASGGRGIINREDFFK